jgi:hypothetical protein
MSQNKGQNCFFSADLGSMVKNRSSNDVFIVEALLLARCQRPSSTKHVYALYQAYGEEAQKCPKTVCTENIGAYSVNHNHQARG